MTLKFFYTEEGWGSKEMGCINHMSMNSYNKQNITVCFICAWHDTSAQNIKGPPSQAPTFTEKTFQWSIKAFVSRELLISWQLPIVIIVIFAIKFVLLYIWFSVSLLS